MPLELLPLPRDLAMASALGPESVFRRRRIPETAYETGYVKYDEERSGAARCEGRERDGGDEGCGVFADGGMFGYVCTG